MIRRILYGLDRPPRGIAWDHPRVPSVLLGPGPLRLNTHPVPPAFIPAGIECANRHAALREWLETACGDYAAARVRFVHQYLAFIDAELQNGRAGLNLFEGLYTVEDWTWSALRPLPRAWIDVPGGPVTADFAFWTGTQVIAIQLAKASYSDILREAGVLVLESPGALDAVLPASFRNTWQSEALPSSPFRRAISPP